MTRSWQVGVSVFAFPGELHTLRHAFITAARTQGFRCAMSRRRRHTQTRGLRCGVTEPEAAWTVAAYVADAARQRVGDISSARRTARHAPDIEAPEEMHIWIPRCLVEGLWVA